MKAWKSDKGREYVENMKTDWHGRIPPKDALGTLIWIRKNIALPEGVREHIDDVIKQSALEALSDE